MSGSYDDSKYGVIQRKWFGLTKKMGGDAGSGFTFGTTDATVRTQLSRWYPRGPIRILKIGGMVEASIIAGSQDTTDRIEEKFLYRGGSASALGTFSWDINGGTLAPYTYASLEFTTPKRNKVGEYITIKSGTPETAGGTAANTATTAGTVAYFVDWVPAYDGSNDSWDVRQ